MSDQRTALEEALLARGGFERDEDAIVSTTTPFETTVEITGDDGDGRLVVRMVLPTLDAVVADETVAPVVQAGWFETLERRLADVDGALRGTAAVPAVDLDERAGTVTVTAAIEPDRPDQGADDAAALIGFIEGTYLEGVIPGYTYREPVAGLLESAYDRSQDGGY